MGEAIRIMFARIADRYDLGNTVLSFGVHWLWKWQLVRLCDPQPHLRWLDCATGTGDIAFLAARATGTPQTIVGIDFCAPMLERAQRRAQAKQMPIQFQQADVLQLPFPDNTFDRATIAFGIRNVDDPLKALREMARVVRPGGIVGILEFGQPSGLIAPLYRWYSRWLLPRIGGWISGDRRAYEYLQHSAWHFPSGSEFLKLMDTSQAFAHSEARPLFGGIAFLYRGIVQ